MPRAGSRIRTLSFNVALALQMYARSIKALYFCSKQTADWRHFIQYHVLYHFLISIYCVKPDHTL
jgi:hypothetical protein